MSTSPAPKPMTASEVFRPKDLVQYQTGAVVSRTLIKCPTGTITVFAFDEGQGLSEPTAAFDALVQLLEGEAQFTIAGKPFTLRVKEAILLPANQPHSVTAPTPFKMLLTMIRS